MKWVKILALLFVCCFGAIAFVAWRGVLTLRQGMADCLIWQGESLSERFILDEETAHEMVASIKVYAQGVAAGTQPAINGFAILRAFYDGPLLLALLHSSIVNRLEAIEAADEFDRQNATKVSQQFFCAVQDKRISAEIWQKIREILLEQKINETESSIGFVIPEQVEGFRKKIGVEALADCLAVMQQALADAGATGDVAVLDPVIELKRILNSSGSR
ncbi:MAG: hypothetical protein GQF41_0909 [Candidatus Rifleibacterium amylolyticum]|nr:MAG: hypothetical protein GQF41_0909 [Candidatus Rifleibacterium amylolyticum]